MIPRPFEESFGSRVADLHVVHLAAVHVQTSALAEITV